MAGPGRHVRRIHTAFFFCALCFSEVSSGLTQEFTPEGNEYGKDSNDKRFSLEGPEDENCDGKIYSGLVSE